MKLENIVKKVLVGTAILSSLLLANPSTETINTYQKSKFQKTTQSAKKRIQKQATDKKYDNHSVFATDSLDDILNCTQLLSVTHEFEIEQSNYTKNRHGYTFKNTKKSKTKIKGYGTVLKAYQNTKRALYLTCDHVTREPYKEITIPLTNPETGEIIVDKKGNPLIDKKVTHLGTTYAISIAKVALGPMQICDVELKLKKVASDKDLDLAVLESEPINSASFAGQEFKNYTFKHKWGNSDELEQGDFLYVVGYPNLLGKMVTSGQVSLVDTKTPNTLYSQAKVNPGNSGGPVFAIRDGNFEYIGMTRFLIQGKYSGITKVNTIKKWLDKIGLGFIHK